MKSRLLTISVALGALYFTILPEKEPRCALDYTMNMTTEGSIEFYGYPYERHSVETEDGYTLNMIRLPHKYSQRLPVVIVHGFSAGSHSWVMMGPEGGLAYKLFNEGHDVWLADLRGNAYSIQHKTLEKNDPEFWNFSFDEIGRYDHPAIIDYILNETKSEKLIHAGYSMGSASYFIMNSLRPDYNAKVAAHIAMAPAVFLSNSTSAYWKLFHFLYYINKYEHRAVIDTVRPCLCENIIDLKGNLHAKIIICGTQSEVKSSVEQRQFFLDYQSFPGGVTGKITQIMPQNLKQNRRSITALAENPDSSFTIQVGNPDWPGSYCHGAVADMIRAPCNFNSLGRSLCRSLASALLGPTETLKNDSLLDLVGYGGLTGSSVKTAEHFTQLHNTGRFQRFDYGESNMKHYNQSTPLEYDLSRTSVPVYIFYGSTDVVSSPQDILVLHETLAKSNPAKVERILIDEPYFNHGDFFMSDLAGKSLNPKIVDVINKINENYKRVKVSVITEDKKLADKKS